MRTLTLCSAIVFVIIAMLCLIWGVAFNDSIILGSGFISCIIAGVLLIYLNLSRPKPCLLASIPIDKPHYTDFVPKDVIRGFAIAAPKGLNAGEYQTYMQNKAEEWLAQQRAIEKVFGNTSQRV